MNDSFNKTQSFNKDSKDFSKSHYSIPIGIISRVIDVLIVMLCGLGVYYIQFELKGQVSLIPQNYLLVLVFSSFLCLLVFPVFSVYTSWRGKNFLHQARMILGAWVTVLSLVVLLLFLVKVSTDFSRLWFVSWGVSSFILLVSARKISFILLDVLRKRGFNHKRIVVIGAGELGQEVVSRVQSSSWAGFDVLAFFDDDTSLSNGKFFGIPVLSNIDNLPQFVTENNIDEVWIALPLRAEERMQSVMYGLRHNLVNIKLLPDIFGMRLINHSVSDMLGLPMVALSATPMDGINRYVKAVEDRVIAFLILILISPVMLLVSIGVKFSSPGPVFYKQERVGFNGNVFNMLKFRSMPVDVEKNTGAVWAKAGENRATKFGSFLRKTSLDELPQFINVLIGNMSIVGPRPERTVFVEKFKDEIPDYMKKHLVKAGVTGWAQINGWRGDTDLGTRIEYDMFYIENWSLWFDLKIIFLTIFKGFVDKNAY